jgi:hypothetical protein
MIFFFFFFLEYKVKMYKHQEMHTTSLNLCICANESFTSDFFLQKEHARQLIIVHLICELTTPINKT